MNPLISVIIPVFNVEEYIRECVLSVLNQNFNLQKMEIIIINDGSSDNSIRNIQDLIDKHTNIRLIDQSNSGLASARNAGIYNASGKYISFIDSDDKVSPNFISELYSVAEEENADIVRGSFTGFDGHDPIKWVPDFNIPTTSGIKALSKLLDMNVSLVVWSSVYRTDFIKENKLRFIDGIILEDGEFTVTSYMKANRVATCSSKNYFYRVRENSILTSNDAEKMSNSEEIIVSRYLSLFYETKSVLEKNVINKAIYEFLRDWTRILSKNKVKLSSDTCFYTACKTLIPVLKHTGISSQLKMIFKIGIIIFKNGVYTVFSFKH
ncbi:glycosyltransferase [Weissella paramesenteroides]|uniref:glycosyltransferase n=1 Tax=Weissella paramesenteroides TaxID=1249 RepID=UPI00123B4FE2|nr:glycosyltransferase [Weissella paramesenteroides]KAA8453752.1 glycosyltransferase [Weissella paramesenteroides]KAA8457765.1 glycosyltransferase [Weissella paramesenteroides]KAA8460276.1 glycosyltransferase [Weissella paramesenteroides]KAA8460778.1 glycosyltransferase [Weissella paramesenteroides]KAA8461643.1 glycosyltransferase [Weissella paramesenteroides]